MNNTNTPETDAYIGEENEDNMTEGEIAMCGYARRLEIQRNAEYSEIVRLRGVIQQALVTPAIVKDHVLSQALSLHNSQAQPPKVG